jgi:hypothetical protein
LKGRRTSRSLFGLLCALSGCLWAGIAFLIGGQVFGEGLVGGALAAPLIGVLAGQCFRPAYGLGWPAQLGVALATLYLASALFGAASGAYEVVAFHFPPSSDGGPMPSEVLIQSVLGALWGITFTGYALLLWPLAFLNHRALGPFAR